MERTCPRTSRRICLSKPGMKTLYHIFLGWFFWLTNRRNDLANKRLPICVECQFRKGFTCGECGCWLQAKARIQDEECPKGKW